MPPPPQASVARWPPGLYAGVLSIVACLLVIVLPWSTLPKPPPLPPARAAFVSKAASAPPRPSAPPAASFPSFIFDPPPPYTPEDPMAAPAIYDCPVGYPDDGLHLHPAFDHANLQPQRRQAQPWSAPGLAEHRPPAASVVHLALAFSVVICACFCVCVPVCLCFCVSASSCFPGYLVTIL